MSNKDVTIYGTSVTILSSFPPKRKVLGAHTVFACPGLEPGIFQSLVLEHADAPKVKPHSRAVNFHKLAGDRRLGTVVYHRVLFRRPPYLGNATFALCPIQAADTSKLRVFLHLLEQFKQTVRRRNV